MIVAVTFSSTISLGVLLVGIVTILASGFAVWRTQSVSALRQSNVDLRADRDDWKERAETQKIENDRQAQKIVELTQICNDNKVEIARLQERTDTTLLAKEAVVAAFREEMRGAVNRLESSDQQKLDLLKQQSEMINTLITRDPGLRTRAGDPNEGAT